MIIIGIDPGLATTGFGIIKIKKSGKKKTIKSLDYGIIQTKPKQDQEKRLKRLFLETSKLLKKYKPDFLFIERVYFFKNLKTALPVSEAKGVIMLAAAKKNIRIKQFTPLQVKMIVCGYGKATKDDVQKKVKKILKIKNPLKPDDVADALAIALCDIYKK